jgi:hypothetical protein
MIKKAAAGLAGLGLIGGVGTVVQSDPVPFAVRPVEDLAGMASGEIRGLVES